MAERLANGIPIDAADLAQLARQRRGRSASRCRRTSAHERGDAATQSGARDAPVRRHRLSASWLFEFFTPGFSRSAARPAPISCSSTWSMRRRHRHAQGAVRLRPRRRRRALGARAGHRLPPDRPRARCRRLRHHGADDRGREQAEELANACRYRPEGRRGLGFAVAHDDYAARRRRCPRCAEANERTLVIALIETATEASRNADAILAVPGIDVGWLGHYDLTDSMGITGDFERPEFHAAVDALLGACDAARQGAGGPGDNGGADARVAPARIPLPRLWRRCRVIPRRARRGHPRRSRGVGRPTGGCIRHTAARRLAAAVTLKSREEAQ